jgi:hypothetical protein
MLKKSSFAAIAFAIITLISFNSCRKELPVTVSPEEIADIVSNALQYETSGAVMEALSAVTLEDIYTALDEHCNETFDSTLNYSYSQNTVSADYERSMEWVVNCTGFNIPTDIAYTSTANGEYSTFRMSSVDASSNELTITGLDIGGGNYFVNGTSVRTGTQESNIRDISLSSTCDLTLEEVEISKSTYEIIAGEGTVTVTGENSGGNSFSFTGSIVFNGDGTATLTLNGTEYTINL